MRRNTLSRALVAALSTLSAALTACALDTTSPRQLSDDDLTSADVAVSAGAGIAEDVGVLLLNELVLGQSPPAGSPTSAASAAAAPSPGWSGSASCAYDAGSGRFQCPVMTQDGLTLTRSYAFLDTTGAPQASYDPAATASADFRAAIAGSVTRDDWTAGLQRTLAVSASGLAGAEVRRTWTGSGSRIVSGAGYTAGGVTRRYELEEADTLANIVVALPRRDKPWPISGVAIRRVTGAMTYDGAASASRVVDRRVVVTFNGTSIVPLDAGDAGFWLNLVTGRVVPRE